MKRILVIIFAFCIIMSIASCARDMPVDTSPAEIPATEISPAPPEPIPFTPPNEPDESNYDDYPNVPAAIDVSFPGRIAIVTNELDYRRDSCVDSFRSAEAIAKRYGSDRVIHKTWPDNYINNEMMSKILTELAEDSEIGAIIINTESLWGFNTLAAIDAVRAIRGDDIFIATAGTAARNSREVSARVNLALDINHAAIGSQFVAQAIEMGAEAIVHISFARHMAVPRLAARRDSMKDVAAAVGIPFHELNSYDHPGFIAQMYIDENMPGWVEKFGENTVFFATECSQQIALLQQLLVLGAMYVMPCCPSPFHGFQRAFGFGNYHRDGAGRVTIFRDGVAETIEATRQVIDAAGMRGRFSNWILAPESTWTNLAFYYAVEWLNGEIIQNPGDAADIDLINRLFADYTESIFGRRYYAEFTNLQIDSETFPMYVVGLLPFVVY